MRRSLLKLKLLGQSIFWKNNENILGQYLSSVSKIDHFNEFGPILSTKSVKKALKNSKLNETIVKANVISKVPDKSKPDDSIETKYTKAVKARKIQTNKKNQVKSVETDITDCSEVKKIKSFPMFCEYRVSSIAPDYTSSADIMKFPYEYSPELPSVSRILSATMSEESKAALAKWEKEKIALLGEEGFRKFKADMFARGKTLHSMLENFLETRSLPGVADIEDQVSKRHLVSISQMIHNFDRPLAIESAMVHSDLGYSGIADCVAVINDTVTLIDWKTSERVKNSSKALYDNPLQLAAYIGAFNSDPRYKHLGNITHGAVVVVYNTGYPAMLHTFDQKQLGQYWLTWCQRLHQYKSMISK